MDAKWNSALELSQDMAKKINDGDDLVKCLPTMQHPRVSLQNFMADLNEVIFLKTMKSREMERKIDAGDDLVTCLPTMAIPRRCAHSKEGCDLLKLATLMYRLL